MTNKNQYLKNATINYLAFFINIVITFIITPFVISALGDHLYGYWTIIVAFTGYFGFLDFGVRAGVGQYVTRYLASEDYYHFNRVVQTSLVALIFIGLSGILLSGLMSFLFPSVFFETNIINPEFKISLFIVGLAICIKFPFVVFQAILQGIHRYDITGGIGIFCKLFNAISVYFVLSHNQGVLGLAFVTFATQLLEGIITLLAAMIFVPETKLRFKINYSSFREVTGYGIYSFWTNAADQISFYIGPILVGRHLGAIAVTYYSVAANIMPYLVSLVQAASTPLMQIATSHDSRGEDSSNQRLFVVGTRYIFWMVCLVGANIYVSGEIFLGKWIGEKYINGIEYPSSGEVIRILVLGYMAFLSHSVGRQILFGKRLNRFLAIFSTLTAIGVVGFTYTLLHGFNIIGAALGLSISMLVVNGIILPAYTSRSVGISFWNFLKFSIFPNATLFVLTIFLLRFFPYTKSQSTWLGIFSCCVLTTLCFVSLTIIVYSAEIRKLFQSERHSVNTTL